MHKWKASSLKDSQYKNTENDKQSITDNSFMHAFSLEVALH